MAIVDRVVVGFRQLLTQNQQNMQVEIKSLETEEFRAALTKALAGSVIGDVVMKIIQGAATDYQVKQSIESVVREHMTKYARSIISENKEFQDMLESKVKELINETLLNDLVAKIKVDRY